MIDLSRVEDKQATVGTVTFFALLLIMLIIMGLMHGCTDVLAEEDAGGGVAVSLGNPEDGGNDNSAAEQTEDFTEPEEPVVEEYVPESQVTSDVAEAPPVKKTEPTPTKPKKPTTKPVEKKPEPKEPDPKSQFPGSKKSGNDATGNGKGKPGRGGYTGKPDGKPDGSPDGNGGTGNSGTGTSSGPSDGPGPGSGIKGNISGFKVAKVKQPAGGGQEQGVIRLKVCVDASGNVIPSSIKYSPDRDPNTSSDLGLRQKAISAMKQFKFTNTSGSSGGCGYYTFTFKLQ